MADKKPISENGLDELLRGMYLEEQSKTIHEDEAAFILKQDYPVKPDPKKEAEFLRRLQNNQGSLGGSSLYLSLFLILGVAVILWLYFSRTNWISSNMDQISQSTKTITVAEDNTSISEENRVSPVIKDNDTRIKTVDTFGRPKITNVISIKDTFIAGENENLVNPDKNPETSIPYLPEKDKARYHKVKEQMLQKLFKLDKGLYTHVEANKIFYAGKNTIIDAFTIRNVGITNLEYKTFLADLLVQKRDDDYLTAQVIPENWSKYNYNTLALSYFHDEKYNDFPVVNISYEGAKLFCKWLEEELKNYMRANNLKVKPLTIRLPYDEEWICAAGDGYAKIAFEKGYNTIYDITEGLVDKSFAKRAEIIKKRVKRVDSLYTLYTTNRYGWTEKEITDFLNLGLKSYTTFLTDTINIERMKVFGKIGRVSEMVCQRNSTRIWLPGLSWKSKEEYLKLENEFKLNLSSPFVGFRFVIINSDDPEYKRPFY